VLTIPDNWGGIDELSACNAIPFPAISVERSLRMDMPISIKVSTISISIVCEADVVDPGGPRQPKDTSKCALWDPKGDQDANAVRFLPIRVLCTELIILDSSRSKRSSSRSSSSSRSRRCPISRSGYKRRSTRRYPPNTRPSPWPRKHLSRTTPNESSGSCCLNGAR
jgi:hypothetical protein